MKEKTLFIDGDRITINNNPVDFDEELPDNLDFSTLKEIPNPIHTMIMLDPDIAKFFKTSKEVNSYLRQQLSTIQV